MKKTISLILALMLCMSLMACGSASSKKDNDPDGSVGAKIDIDIDFDFTHPSYESFTVGEHRIEFNMPDFDFTFTVEPVTVTRQDFSFEFGDYQFTFDVDTFDVGAFAEVAADNFSEEDIEEVEQLEVEEVVTVAETRANLLADLRHAFETSGLAVQVNEDTGEISLDSSILFEVDQATISPEGKEFLIKFLTVYTTVVCHEKYDGFISKVLVEGHTDSDGNYNYNLTLSEKRADSVKAFCLSTETGLDKSYIAFLEDSMEAKGYSSDKLVYDESGNEDKAASRRVSFRFLIALP